VAVQPANSLITLPSSGPPSNYLALSTSYKNPAITRESKGLKLSISPNATWNSQMYDCITLLPLAASLFPPTGNGRSLSLKLPPTSALEHCKYAPCHMKYSMIDDTIRFYHFSVKRSNTNAPNSALEHQVMFFESHFTEVSPCSLVIGSDRS
jgi:hypothetical protein